MIYQYTIGFIESILETVFIILIGISNSYLLSLLLLAIIVRLATKPLEKYVNRAVNSQAEIESILTPQIEVIKSQYSGVKRHNVIKRLYTRYSYHPVFAIRSLAGIGAQLPFFIAAYFMLSGYSELDGVIIPVLGDLGKPDTLLFSSFHLMPFVMTLVNILALITVPGFTRKNLIQGLIISLMFLVLLYESPVSLLIYWTTSNLFSLISNFAPTISEKIKFKKSKARFKITFIGRTFEDYAYLFFITNLAISIPLLGVLGEQFNFFTSHNLSSNYIIKLLLVISIAPTFILCILRWLSKRVGFVNGFDKTVLFIFLGLFLLYTLNKVGYGFFPSNYEPYILFLLTLFLTVVAVIFVFKKDLMKSLSSLSLIIPLVFLNFIFVSPASSLFKHSNKNFFPDTSKMNDTPVFLLIFDEISGLTLQNSKGQLDELRFPGIAELATNADYFPNALTVDYRTDISIPSIASGNLRSDPKNRGLAKGENLIELFKAKGDIDAYSIVLPADLLSKQSTDEVSFVSDFLTLYTHIISHQDWIEDRIGVIPQTWKGFGIFFKSNQPQEKEDALNPHAKQFIDWTKNLNETWSINQFNFLHFKFPHAHYNTTTLGRPVSNSTNILDSSKQKENFFASQPLLNVLSHNYIQQSVYTDHLIQNFIQVLKDRNIFDKSLIIITSDHGVSYNKKGRSRRVPKNEDSWKNIISVPLFIKYPFQKEGKVNSSYVTTLDISSTVLNVVGIDSPWVSIGQNLNKMINDSQTKSVNLIPKYNEYFKKIKALFQSARERNKSLFGEGTPIHTKAVNYTENSIYDALLMTNIDELTIGPTSRLSTVFGSSLDPQEISHYGVLYQNQQKVNNIVTAAVIEGKVQAIFVSGKAVDKDGFYAFSLPEKDIVPTEFNISLYEIESVTPFVMRRIEISNLQNLLEDEFQSKKTYPYDWGNSVHSSNGLDSISVENGRIQLLSSKSNDPYIIFNTISSKSISEPIIHLELESNRDLLLQVFYQTEHNPKFTAAQAINYEINKGTNSFYIKVPDNDLLGRFRIDIGNKKIVTKVVIKDIEIKY